MRQIGQFRQAVVWGCIGLFSSCPYFDRGSNALPLAFGMTPQEVAIALDAPLAQVSVHKGAEIYYAERQAATPSFFPVDRRLWLQFRRGHLTGWRNDWDKRPWW
jgi:hypothetical protein